MTRPLVLLSENSRAALMPTIIQTKPEKFRQFLAAFISTLSAVSMGMVFSWTSSANPMLEKKGLITSSQGAWIGSLVTLGAFVGAIPTGNLANIVGRKRILQILAIPLFMSWIIIAYLNQYLAALYFARFLAGLVLGGISVAAPMYVAELAHVSIKGALGTLFQVQITVGLLIEYVLGALITDFQTLALASSVLPVVFLISFAFMPESPVFLCSKGKTTEAKQSLLWFRGANYDVEEEMNSISEEIYEGQKNRAKLSDLIKCRATFKGLIICFGLMTFQQLSGVNAVLFYTNQIFSGSAGSMSPNTCSILIGSVQVVATLASTALIEKAGRKILLVISDFVMCLSLAGLGFYFYFSQYHDLTSFSIVPLISVSLFIIFFSIGLGPIPWMIMGEIFPSKIKGIASSLSSSLNWIIAFTVTNQFTNMTQAFGTGVTFLVFSVVCGIGTCFISYVVPETKGKSVEEVRNLLTQTKDDTEKKTTIV